MSDAYNINKDLIETLCSNLLEESIETEQLGRSETFFQDWDGAESYKTILKFKKESKELIKNLIYDDQERTFYIWNDDIINDSDYVCGMDNIIKYIINNIVE